MKSVIWTIIAFFLISLFQPIYAAKEKEKLEDIQKELQESREKLEETKKEEEAVLGRLVTINKELKQKNHYLNKAQEKIVTNKNQIITLSKEIYENKKSLEQIVKELALRVKEVYKSSRIHHLELIFGAKSMTDFLNRLYFLGKIVEEDTNLIKETQSDLHITKNKTENLKAKNEEIEVLTENIKVEQEEIKVKLEEKEAVYKKLKDRRAEYEEKIAELEKSSNELEELIKKQVAKQTETGKVVKSTGELQWPLKGRITSRFGYRRHPYWGGRHLHTGLDIAAPQGKPVVAADSGKVILSGWWNGYGKSIVIDHGNNTTTVYAHLSRIYKQVDDTITKGQTIGLVGSTGYSSGPHLHFEVRKNGKPIDPASMLP